MEALQWFGSQAGLSLIAATTGLLAVIVSPLVAFLTAKKQIEAGREAAELNFKASFESASRQQWINQLRDLVSEFSATVLTVEAGLLAGELTGKDLVDELRELARIHEQISLMVNASEPDHSALLFLVARMVDNVTQAFKSSSGPAENPVGTAEYLVAARMLTRRVLKAEWDKARGVEGTTGLPPRPDNLRALLSTQGPPDEGGDEGT